MAVNLGARIKKLREERDIPSCIVAEAIGMTLAAYEAAEQGETLFSAKEIYLIGKTMGVSSDEILSAL